MCGIFCSLSTKNPIYPCPGLQYTLTNRGPDSQAKKQSTVTRRSSVDGSSTEVHVVCLSTVLALRGSITVKQPYSRDGSESTLCWNGEAWRIGGEITQGNDTQAIFELLERTAQSDTQSYDRAHLLLAKTRQFSNALSRVAGPYAFAFHDKENDFLFFGRDFLGRRSLLVKVTDDGDLVLSSITNGDPREAWREVHADGLYCIDLQARNFDTADNSSSQEWGQFDVVKVPYSFVGDAGPNENNSVIPRLSLNKDLNADAVALANTSASVLALEKHLRDSLSLRILNIPNPPLRENENHIAGPRSKLAILFSGGLDCTILARLAHDILPLSESIDLLNVAFENPRVHKSNTKDAVSNPFELCPDRVTGRASYNELRQICPYRTWRFVAVDVPYSEALECRPKIVVLMHPHNTEMDLSICYALYFASRGRGLVTSADDQSTPYTTSARILLSGLGADELFGGYTRHATAFNRHGHDGLANELDLDISRLGQRNLGRDDRVFSNSSREVRFPFLDEQLVQWALSVPVDQKCDFAAATGRSEQTADANDGSHLEPGKKVLRCLAWRLNMRQVASEKKRAIQFGARTAKMVTGKTKGTTLLTT